MNYDEPMKVGESVNVYDRLTPIKGEPLECELVSILNQKDGIIAVDDGHTIRIARWIGCDFDRFEF